MIFFESMEASGVNAGINSYNTRIKGAYVTKRERESKSKRDRENPRQTKRKREKKR